MTKEEILKKLKGVTTSAGIYLWKNAEDEVVYVGKAKNLRNRMHQYFEGAENSYKTSKLVQDIADFEVFVVNNDKEALLLERQFISKYNPVYNILLRDDKKYPYIKVELKQKLFINLSFKVKHSDSPTSFYFGPFPNGYGARPILKLLEREAFYEKGLYIKNDDYEFWKEKFEKIKGILKFNSSYINELERKMYEAADNNQFAIAKDLKDCWTYLKKLNENQVIELKEISDIDVFSAKEIDNFLYINIIFYRYGILIHREFYTIPIKIDLKHTFETFVNRFYNLNLIPNKIISNINISDFEFDFSNLSQKFILPKTGINAQILSLGLQNIDEYYKNNHLQIKDKAREAQAMLELLKTYVPVKDLKQIVLFDNSNLNNTNPIGVAVVYIDGVKSKSLYRKYNHENLIDQHADVQYMKMTAEKYLRNLNFNVLPSLIIVDGGLQQVNAVQKVLNFLDLDIPLVGLVKDDKHRTRALINLEREEVEIADKKLFSFLAEMQIEVDRFAKEHFRTRHRISSLDGKLRSIKGLGEMMENRLLSHFKSYSDIYNASVEELSKVVPKHIAEKIFNKEFLKK